MKPTNGSNERERIKNAKQKKLEDLTPRERMDMEKYLTWFYKFYQQKKANGEELD
ncbi:hypothetical protein [Ekhidna sp.]|uniref:hypothetical protein n=1 Tax=Ekhidna sp. TaxID=2608089 RepID=UPI003B5CD00B